MFALGYLILRMSLGKRAVSFLNVVFVIASGSVFAQSSGCQYIDEFVARDNLIALLWLAVLFIPGAAGAGVLIKIFDMFFRKPE
jgi:hypothetical protein